ncbi:hypothetical protein EUX98_g6023 [Antrodiella citrinella]|uniref:Uncharacterized protein n=1 Tax=Antrodiella citrinella TaxID=2447956 RepID=A0A4V3XI79_9APHY|nr:hypothetical protein EUX98_g6023 [Antrodiella citrinella]
MFPALDELHLLDLAVDGKERFMRLLTDNSVYPVTKLEVRNAQAVMYLVPEKVFRRVNVLHADMKLLLLVKTLFFTPLYDVLEELTLTSSGRYHVEALAKMDGHFVSSCLRLKALHILDSRTGRQTDYSPAIIFRGFKALLDVSPKTLSHVSVGFLLFRWDKRQMDQLKSMEWKKVQELVLGRFPMLAKLSVVGVPDALTPATAGLLIAPIPAAWKPVVRSRLGADFLDKVVFE